MAEQNIQVKPDLRPLQLRLQKLGEECQGTLPLEALWIRASDGGEALGFLNPQTVKSEVLVGSRFCDF